MVKQVFFANGVTAVGQYCQIPCALPPGNNQPVPQEIVAATFFGNGTGTFTGGTVQPIILTGIGTWQPFGAILTITAAGTLAFNPQQLVTPVLGVGIAILTAITGGGTLYLECDVVII